MSLNNQPEYSVDNPVSPQPLANKKLSVGYRPWKKSLAVLGFLVLLPVLWFSLTMNFFILEILMVAVMIFIAWHVSDCLATREITFYPDKIVKRSYVGETVIPAAKLVMIRKDRDICFFHGAKENIRESIKISGALITEENNAYIHAYVQNVYHIKPYLSGVLRSTSLAFAEFNKAVASFRLMAICSAIYLLAYGIIATYVVGQDEVFNGFARSIPAYPARLLCVVVAIAAYFLLKRQAGNIGDDHMINRAPVMVRSQQACQRAYTSAFVACGVAGLGLPLFLLFGDKLDFYLFLLVGVLYFYDFYPRLSTWEQIVENTGLSKSGGSQQPNMPRRSLQVSLALLGTLSVLSYGANRPYLPANNQDCKDDQGNSVECPRSGHSSSWHGGSGYGGNNDANSTRSDVGGTTRRGGFGFFGNSHSSFGG